ncbi:TetR/AcrR family transcriptional regulator [Desulfitibacter alkalitolerans]|uniref:TetR/AcrR family transcriptional regulator n=1 Tax=Desulfitibacter alkalitolerans TaxID=264641 RepID=UPI0006856D2F|nr:TetR/AcrR family transcriptional regulator [Desulfitibacter alkalitolerans]
MGNMDGFEKRRQKKKESIRRAAFELFSVYGVQKVTMAEIAKKANVSQVTIYNYFGSKDELLKDVVMDLMERKWREYKELLDGDLPFQKKIEAIIFDKRETARNLNQDFLKSIYLNHPEIREYFEEFYEKKSIPMVLEIMEQGKREGHINRDISMEAILFYMKIFKEAVSNPDFFSNHNKDIQLDINHLFFYGLVGKPLE